MLFLCSLNPLCIPSLCFMFVFYCYGIISILSLQKYQNNFFFHIYPFNLNPLNGFHILHIYNFFSVLQKSDSAGTFLIIVLFLLILFHSLFCFPFEYFKCEHFCKMYVICVSTIYVCVCKFI